MPFSATKQTSRSGRGQSTTHADYGYILESGRIVMDGPAKALAENKDVKEFYLGMASEGRKSFRDMKSYRQRKRWV
jgi:branched-chain amino acid transport system ATP-binding protein